MNKFLPSFFIFLLPNLFVQAQVTYTVKVPAGTNACFIAGEFNGWMQREMNKVNDSSYTLTVASATTAQQYKYCSGPGWMFVEKGPNNEEVANRTYKPADTVAKWAAIWSPGISDGPAVPSGTIKRMYFRSNYVDSRIVDIWLPAGYTPAKKYAVLYMHDGQNLFDSSTNTFKGVEWEADETATRLMQQGRIRDVIIVGPWNNGARRYAEYFPQKVLDSIPEPEKTLVLNMMAGPPEGDDYLKFLVLELKPFIDSAFSTCTNQQNTFVMGSSMGGLISWYALCEYPNVFYGAGCMSTHWPGLLAPNYNVPHAFNRYLLKILPLAAAHKIYYDHGTLGIDATYPPYQLLVDTIMKHKGYGSTVNWMTRRFPGHDHTEGDWAKRLDTPFHFLLQAPLNIPLPVQLRSFEARWQKKDVVLQWITASENNTQFFEVERSINGRSFTTAGRIAATGHSVTEKAYTFTEVDVNNQYPSPPKYFYYRLKMVDKDAAAVYSPVVRIINQTLGKNMISVYPNPAKNLLHLHGLETANAYRIRLSGVSGMSQDIFLKAGTNAVQVSHLAAGSYMLEIEGQVIQFIKQ